MSNQKILVLVFFFTVIFFVFFLPYCDEKKKMETLINTEPLKLYDKQCHPKCCNYNVWPALDPDLNMYNYDPKSPYVSSNFSCSQGPSSGCPCLTKEDYNYLTLKGGNGGNCA